MRQREILKKGSPETGTLDNDLVRAETCPVVDPEEGFLVLADTVEQGMFRMKKT